MKNVAFYHIYMPDDLSWTYLFIDQMREMLESGTAKKLSEFRVTAIGTEVSFKHIHGLLTYYQYLMGIPISLVTFNKTYNDKELVNLDRMQNALTETITLGLLKNYCDAEKEPFNVLYFHAKGVTSIERALPIGDYGRFVNSYYWRKFTEWGAFEKCDEALELLKTNDTVGVNYSKWPTPHYSGNVWWANSDYIKTLNHPEDRAWWEEYKKRSTDFSWLPDRLVGEMWIGSGVEPKMYSFHDHQRPPPISNLGSEIILRNEYYK